MQVYHVHGSPDCFVFGQVDGIAKMTGSGRN
jgi:hypothetical protein